MKRYAQEQGENMFINGVVTSCGPTACEFADDADWTAKLGTDAYITPEQGWNALYETMNAPFTPEENSNGQSLQVPNPLQQQSLPFVTDFANGVR